jgi:DNA modification methylase
MRTGPIPITYFKREERVTMPKPRLNDLEPKEWFPLTKSWFKTMPDGTTIEVDLADLLYEMWRVKGLPDESWFFLKTTPRSRAKIKHPATFPPELPARFIEFFTRKGDWVIDPFLGTGTTLIEAQRLGRNGAGFELNKEYVTQIRASLSETLLPTQTIIYNRDACFLADYLEHDFRKGLFALCATSPPYFKMLGKHRGGSNSQHGDRAKRGLPLDYGNLPGDLGIETDYQVYLAKLHNVFLQLKDFMRPGGFLVIVLQNIWGDDGQCYPMAWDLAAHLRADYNLYPEQIWIQDNKQMGFWGYPSTFISNIHHHYCLIFQAPRAD